MTLYVLYYDKFMTGIALFFMKRILRLYSWQLEKLCTRGRVMFSSFRSDARSKLKINIMINVIVLFLDKTIYCVLRTTFHQIPTHGIRLIAMNKIPSKITMKISPGQF